jgi:mannose-6-phosphate isomerase
MYLGADDIHAYISGQLMECMASSDNVINGGFTTDEPRDEALLAKSLSYYIGEERGLLLCGRAGGAVPFT